MVQNRDTPLARDMALSDLSAVAELHRHCFSENVSLFSALSSDVLRHYYSLFVEEPESYAAVLEEPGTGRIIGVTFGTRKPGIRGRFVKRYYFKFLWNFFVGLFSRASLWKALWSRLRGIHSLSLGSYDCSLANAGVPPLRGPEDILMGIAVHRQFRGAGNAARLIEYYNTRVFARGALRIRTAILTSNIASMKFFKRLGWQFRELCSSQVSVWIDRPDTD
ncbi:MAG: GNAT family N-acetyltransferase [Desulfobacteraceae bacterium]|nr:GNAT family N-acetyltransferase [Desulfobacteraceae bacterium]